MMPLLRNREARKALEAGWDSRLSSDNEEYRMLHVPVSPFQANRPVRRRRRKKARRKKSSKKPSANDLEVVNQRLKRMCELSQPVARKSTQKHKSDVEELVRKNRMANEIRQQQEFKNGARWRRKQEEFFHWQQLRERRPKLNQREVGRLMT